MSLKGKLSPGQYQKIGQPAGTSKDGKALVWAIAPGGGLEKVQADKASGKIFSFSETKNGRVPHEGKFMDLRTGLMYDSHETEVSNHVSKLNTKIEDHKKVSDEFIVYNDEEI